MERILQFDTWNCFVRDEGTGPVVLLVHGFPLDHHLWDQQFPGLTHAYRLIAPDLRGFGRSGPLQGPLSMTGLARDLAQLVDRLAPNQPVVFCGLSMGGYIAWPFWRHHRSRLRGLILCDTRAAGDTPTTAEARERWAAQVERNGPQELTSDMIPRMFASHTFAAYQASPQAASPVPAMLNVMNATPVATIAAAQRAMAARRDSRPDLAQIECPTLAICGADDRITPPSEMQEMARAIPRAEYVEIADAGHVAPLEQPQAVNRAIEQFLRRL